MTCFDTSFFEWNISLRICEIAFSSEIWLRHDLYLNGSLRKIADALYEREIFSSTGKDRWAVQVIDNILSNRLYLHIVAPEKFVRAQLEKQRRSNTNSDHTRKTVRYNSRNVLSGLLVCKECGKNYRRITRKDGEVVWRCADRVENGKQVTCQNLHTVTDTEIKQAICDYLGIDHFDEEAVKEEICRVEIGSDSSAPGERTFSWVKVPNPPVSGKDIAKDKGAPGDGGSEGSRRQNSGLTNRNHI